MNDCLDFKHILKTDIEDAEVMTKQSEAADGPQQLMSGGIPQLRCLVHLYANTNSLISIRSSIFSQCSCLMSGVMRSYLTADYRS